MKENNILCAVIVLYKVNLNDSLTYQSLKKSLLQINEKLTLIIYDNSPVASAESLPEDICFKYVYISDTQNPGVSRAYNVAYDYAKKNAFNYLLLLDQDTIFPDDFISESLKYLDGKNKLIFPTLVNNNNIIISPCKFKLGRGSSISKNKLITGINSIKGRNFLNSGSIIQLNFFGEIGGYDENIPLYFSDFNFYERAKKKVNYFILTKNICLHDMASGDYDDLDKFKTRFFIYCEGANKCFNEKHMKIIMFINTFLRAGKMFFRTGSLIFFKISFKVFF